MVCPVLGGEATEGSNAGTWQISGHELDLGLHAVSA